MKQVLFCALPLFFPNLQQSFLRFLLAPSRFAPRPHARIGSWLPKDVSYILDTILLRSSFGAAKYSRDVPNSIGASWLFKAFSDRGKIFCRYMPRILPLTPCLYYRMRSSERCCSNQERHKGCQRRGTLNQRQLCWRKFGPTRTQAPLSKYLSTWSILKVNLLAIGLTWKSSWKDNNLNGWPRSLSKFRKTAKPSWTHCRPLWTFSRWGAYSFHFGAPRIFTTQVFARNRHFPC